MTTLGSGVGIGLGLSALPSLGGTTVNASGASHYSGKVGDSNVVTAIKNVLSGNIGGSSVFNTAKTASSAVSSSLGSSSSSYKEKFGTTSPSGLRGVTGSSSVSAKANANWKPEKYKYATIGNQYGVDKATAYKEALQNTAIRRQMADLKAAGLNPVLAAKMLGAGSDTADIAFQTAPVQAGSSGSSPDYYSGSSSSAKNAFNFSKVLKNYNAQKAVASVASAGVMAATKNFSLGAAAYYGVQSAFNLLK